ncbi:MAG: phosphatase [Candidatus Dactylopiibacterium carminicum]|uniref:Phosphatase n=1 Tax=Candidatus Dactylopiibacterium carminicum TaxID=857335 RepID=A0A272EQP8_9RHOO|nr:protein phosphatase 2C domain-containing protein [Candidatus Dactylopiibacterium carminicum]KAF7598630.1 serine/threonine-protein phosphatase [Candidatus Dactylopiibacterium carminicum]PAS92396.1 MAG: phosphatase [Candidatus Dactylopiibacterium carminicum]PAS96011.1 MAG: phosphatase [Candidatus Dactylopiibacterium carminicum]PAS98397.1 MAG: phosphatase [Candidatus Dactylopiibacterium carminicum]
MKFTIYQESRPGTRPNNQDRVAYSYTRESLLLVVADGMGGHLHGEVAAQIAVQYIVEAFQRAARPRIQDELMFLSRSLSNAHAAIQDYAFDKNLPEAPRTTIVACLIQNSVAFWAHAGDSRLYMIRRGRIVQQTRDHSRLQMMLDQGLIDEEEAARHPARNRIFSCLGGSHSPQMEFSSPVPLFANDLIVICTDGVWGNLVPEDFTTRLSDTNVLEASPRLMDLAEARGGLTCDNLSMLSMHWHDDYAEVPASTISTNSMPLDGITTKMEGFVRSRGPEGSLSEDEIERAIDEINEAIKKYSRFDPGK